MLAECHDRQSQSSASASTRGAGKLRTASAFEQVGGHATKLIVTRSWPRTPLGTRCMPRSDQSSGANIEPTTLGDSRRVRLIGAPAILAIGLTGGAGILSAPSTKSVAIEPCGGRGLRADSRSRPTSTWPCSGAIHVSSVGRPAKRSTISCRLRMEAETSGRTSLRHAPRATAQRERGRSFGSCSRGSVLVDTEGFGGPTIELHDGKRFYAADDQVEVLDQ
jgi:hypothetical protein